MRALLHCLAFALGFAVGYFACDFRHCSAIGYHAVLSIEGRLCVRDER